MANNDDIKSLSEELDAIFENLQKEAKKVTIRNLQEEVSQVVKDLNRTKSSLKDASKNLDNISKTAKKMKKDAFEKNAEKTFKDVNKELNKRIPILKNLAKEQKKLDDLSLPKLQQQPGFQPDENFKKLIDNKKTNEDFAKGFTKIGDNASQKIVATLSKIPEKLSDAYSRKKQSALDWLSDKTGIKHWEDAFISPLIKSYEFIDTKLLPAFSNLNKSFGNMGQNMSRIRSQTSSVGKQFENLGYDFSEGAEAVKELGSGLMTVQIPKQNLQSLLTISKYVDLGNEQTAKLANQFIKTGHSFSELNNSMKDATKIAFKYGIPVNQIRKDFGENIDILQRFGLSNRKQFLEASARARQYGTTIKDVNEAFGKQLDTFDSASDAAAKLNTIFGTNINSYELLLETDPTKRMEMIRKELDKQGKSWDKLNVFQKNVVKSTLGLSDEQAALSFASEKARKEIQKDIEQKKQSQKINEDWNKGLSNIQRTLINTQQEFNHLFQAIGNAIFKFVGFKGSLDGTTKTTKILSEFLRFMTDKFVELAQWIDKNHFNLSNFIDSIKDVVKTFQQLSPAISTASNLLGHFSTKSSGIKSFQDQFHDLTESIDDSSNSLSELQKKTNSKKASEMLQEYIQSSQQVQQQLQSDLHMSDREILSKLGNSAYVKPQKGTTIKQIRQSQNSVLASPTLDFSSDKGQTIGRQQEQQARSSKQAPININIHPADVVIDGKKIGQVQFKTSTY